MYNNLSSFLHSSFSPFRYPSIRFLSQLKDAPSPLLNHYQGLIDRGRLSFDPQQYQLLRTLDHLSQDLLAYQHFPPPPMFNLPSPTLHFRKPSRRTPKLFSFFRFLFPHLNSHPQPTPPPTAPKPTDTPHHPSLSSPPLLPFGPPTPAPLSLYIHGPVGVGKSLAMDLFYDALPLESPRKRRVHFHDFMAEFHTTHMHRWRQQRSDWHVDPLASIARAIAAETTVLCFDELHITDLVSALFLSTLFRELFYYGVVVVATSNKRVEQLWDTAPEAQRKKAIPQLLRAWQLHGRSFELLSGKDYRRARPLNLDAYIVESKDTVDGMAKLRGRFERETAHLESCFSPLFASETRHITVERRGEGENRVGWATFSQLCHPPFGAAEFSALASALDTLYLAEVPCFNDSNLSEGRRFILLIDQLYERGVKLRVHAHEDLDRLFSFSFLDPHDHSHFEEAVDDRTVLHSSLTPSFFNASESAFMFHRAISRLYELTSDSYSKLSHSSMNE